MAGSNRFGEILREARGELSQESLARLLGIRTDYISKYENGHTKRPEKHAPALLGFIKERLGDDKWREAVDALMGTSSEPTPPPEGEEAGGRVEQDGDAVLNAIDRIGTELDDLRRLVEHRRETG